ncbi:MAG: SapC family protein [Hylemonella sp.]|nr:SapC family protein [Hylemonella sp.]MDP1935712.1 SapC family protein [Hylemonella sp.]
MNTEAQTTAFFYQKPIVLDRVLHKELRLKPADARFASKNQAVPLVAAEFPEACLEYPIVFAKGNDGQWLALALTGLQAGANAFVDVKGQWSARYVPASVRRYPFILAEGAPGQGDQLSLAADLAAPQLGSEGEPLFDVKGEPTELVRNLMVLLADFQNQAKQTNALAQKLDEAGLLTQQNLQVRLGDGRNAVVDGVWIMDEVKLRELPDDKVLAWFKGGELTAIHAHMLSLRNLVPLLERSQPVVTDKPANRTIRKSAGKTKAV